jgi:DNA-binding transcriptional regulator YhcF (GntR family)
MEIKYLTVSKKQIMTLMKQFASQYKRFGYTKKQIMTLMKQFAS